jgi:hypothetical protein
VDKRALRHGKARIVLWEDLSEVLHGGEELWRVEALVADHEYRVPGERTCEFPAHRQPQRLRQVDAEHLCAGVCREPRDRDLLRAAHSDRSRGSGDVSADRFERSSSWCAIHKVPKLHTTSRAYRCWLRHARMCIRPTWTLARRPRQDEAAATRSRSARRSLMPSAGHTQGHASVLIGSRVLDRNEMWCRWVKFGI